MMRSLFSGVSGLKTHQTRMDVIGNNIANVNTTAYKSQNMVFSDLLYQTTQAASGANPTTGRGGINARQIGLGSKTAAINTAITRQGSAQSTNNPWDVMITGESFFIVNSGSQNFFTRDGSFTIDGAGNLVMASTGYTVMGWQYDEETGDIRSDVVSALQVMNRDNLTAPPEYTTNGYASGIVDKHDTNVHSAGGKVMSLKIFDAEGYAYSVLMSIHAMSKDGNYYVQLDDIKNSDGVSLKDYYNVTDISQIATFGAGGQMPPVSKVYGVPDGIDYTPANGTNPASFLVNYPFGEVLSGFDSNPMMSLAESAGTLKITQINGAAVTDKMPASTTTPVTMEGSAELTKDTLQRDYGITYDDKAGCYYYKNAAGDTVPLANDPRTADEVTAWATVLGKLTGGVTINTPAAATDPSPIKVNDDGSVEVTFTAQFTPTRDDLQYNINSGKLAVPLQYTADGGAGDKEVLEKVYGLTDTDNMKYTLDYVTPDGHASVTANESYNGNMLVFDTKTGNFSYIGAQEQKAAVLDFSASATDMTGATVDLGHFSDVSIDFSSLLNIENGKVSTAGLDNGDGTSANNGTGRKYGELIGVEIAQDGKIRASYDNGMTKLLGQIAVAKFANASGLAKAGNNLYSATMNSGDFDGIGQDVTADGEGSMESGILEMSNVDLAGEFTEMITTQRGFQANSRIITTSDTLLEELVNLKR